MVFWEVDRLLEPLRSPVLGHWLGRVRMGNIYLIPAWGGAFVGALVTAAFWKAMAKPFSLKVS